MGTEPALNVHRSLKAAAAELVRAEKTVVTLFAEVLRRKIYRELGYGSMHLYATSELGFSASKTSQFIRLAEAMESLPKLKDAVGTGALPWTKAREVAKVATPETEAAWIGKASRSSRRDLEITIAETRAEAKASRRANPRQGRFPRATKSVVPKWAALPSTVSLRFTPEQLAQFETLMEAVRKRGVRGTRESVLLAVLDEVARAGAPVRSTGRAPYQVVVTLCPNCRGAAMRTSRGTTRLDAASTASVLSDCDKVEGDRRKRSTIPLRIRRRVLERDDYRCRAPGCTNMHFLEIDHIVPLEQGGTNAESNLRVLCSACHRARHTRGAGGSAGGPAGGPTGGPTGGSTTLPG